MGLSLKIGVAIALTLVVHVISRSPWPHLSALAPLFPTFAIIALISVLPLGSDVVRNYAITGLLGLAAYAAFLAGVWISASADIRAWALPIGILLWILMASVVVWMM